MKTYLLVLSTTLFLFGSVTAQKTIRENPKAKKNELSQSQLNKIDALMESKEFEFLAYTVLPMRNQPINIVGDHYSVQFNEDKIESILPYFGVKRGSAYGKDKGMRFEGVPTEYTIKRTEKEYLVNAKVQANGEIYDMTMSVFANGRANLTISSGYRDAIRYRGEVR